MTELLYLKDCYIDEFEAKVIESRENYVVLDKTAFYPKGGGQESDKGFLNKTKVLEVIKEDGKIKHILDKNPFKVNEFVLGNIDWKLRYSYMRMHTAQHLLSAIVLEKYEAETVGNQIGEHESRIDFALFKPVMGDLRYIENRFNELIDENKNVIIDFRSREEVIAEIDEKRRNLFSRVPETVNEVRVITIENIDKCPCAGTHVRNTKEIGHIEIIKAENKGKDTTRINFRLNLNKQTL